MNSKIIKKGKSKTKTSIVEPNKPTCILSVPLFSPMGMLLAAQDNWRVIGIIDMINKERKKK